MGYIDVEFTHDSESYFIDTLPEDRKRRNAVREVPSCKLSAGYIPCGKFNFHQAKNELEFYHMVKALVAHVVRAAITSGTTEWIHLLFVSKTHLLVKVDSNQITK